jgi:hypothetical protein
MKTAVLFNFADEEQIQFVESENKEYLKKQVVNYSSIAQKRNLNRLLK